MFACNIFVDLVWLHAEHRLLEILLGLPEITTRDSGKDKEVGFYCFIAYCFTSHFKKPFLAMYCTGLL